MALLLLKLNMKMTLKKCWHRVDTYQIVAGIMKILLSILTMMKSLSLRYLNLAKKSDAETNVTKLRAQHKGMHIQSTHI